MAAETEAPAVAEPVLLERGRYALSQMPDGKLVITRAGPICETCENCHCGEAGEQIEIPAMIVPFLTGQRKMNLATAAGMMREMFNGNGS